MYATSYCTQLLRKVYKIILFERSKLENNKLLLSGIDFGNSYFNRATFSAKRSSKSEFPLTPKWTEFILR